MIDPLWTWSQITIPKLLGGGTRSMLNLGINKMRDIKNLKDITWKKVGDDLLLTGYL